MKQSLQYLSESLSNYVEDDNVCQAICDKLEAGNFEEEIEFIEVLDEETSTETDQMKGYTLLLVEDNESMRSFIFERLEVLFTVETAVNGQ